MNALQRLDAYIDALRRRLAAHIYVRGASWAAAAVFVIVVAFAWWLARSAFASSLVLAARVALIVAVACIAILGVWLPLRALRRDDGARLFEQRLPEQRGRLATYLEMRRAGEASPLLALLAEDSERIARATPPEAVIPARTLRSYAAATIVLLGALAALLAVGPDPWRVASRHVLLGVELPQEIVPVRTISVSPGDVTVRRNSDLALRAFVAGFDPEQVTVFVRFEDAATWERAPMQRVESNTYAFKLYALRNPLHYYVEADGTRSSEHRVTLADPPKIERVRLTYHYPQWTGLPEETDESSRDIRAVAGTKVTIEIESDAPLEEPVIVSDAGTHALGAREGRNVGTLAVEKPGRYHIAATVGGERVALTDDYAIEIVPDQKPVVQIERPGRDWRATNIEEVPVRVRAHDDFRLQSVELHYSINGGEWRTLPLDGRVKETRKQTLLDLERLGAEQNKGESSLLAPGDLVTYYAVARDHKHTVRTDLFMVQVQPFERKFMQQNAGGGGGGMADEQGAISERQREILLATWNLQRSQATDRRAREQLEDNARMLAEMQTTLAQQARTLAMRTRARAPVESDERVRNFVESLERAAQAMDPAAMHLAAFALEKAVPVEQQALQQLLRAEAAFREVQISMQREGGGRGAQAARDFGEMFELEMDLEKSQYESESQLAENQTSKEMEEALRKLKALAERQEQLAQEARRNPQLTPEQRWRQEQLRREAEDLRRRLAALQREEQSRADESQQVDDRSGAQGGAQGSRAQSGSQREDARGRPRSALDSVDEALARMQAASTAQETTGDEPGSSAQAAASKLREALQRLDRPQPSALQETLEQLAGRASELADEQRSIEADLYNALNTAFGDSNQPRVLRGRRPLDPERTQDLVDRKQALAERLSELQRELRESVHRHRDASADAKRELARIVNDVESSDLMYRMRRSAAEIYYGRVRDAAAREGIITESLELLEKELRQAAVRAAQDGTQSPRDAVDAEQLLAEVAELRRRVEQSERLAGARSEEGRSDSAQDAASGTATSSESPGSESGQASERTNGRAPGGAERTLSAWDPVLPNMRLPQVSDGRDSFARQTASIAERARQLRERAGQRELSAQELAALRDMARELRRLAGDPLAAQSAAMKGAVEQLELAMLMAVTGARLGEAAHAVVPSGDTPQYRETVAEYYRRLGGS